MTSLDGVTSIEPADRDDEAPSWIEGGSLEQWAVVYSRVAHPIATGTQKARFMFTKVEAAQTAPVIQQWLDHLALMDVGLEPSSDQVFWRIAVRQRALALSAQPFQEVGAAVDVVRRMAARASALTVSLGFFPAEPIPRWRVVLDDAPVFVGLPHYHLVRVTQPQASLAALVAGAQIKTKVH